VAAFRYNGDRKGRRDARSAVRYAPNGNTSSSAIRTASDTAAGPALLFAHRGRHCILTDGTSYRIRIEVWRVDENQRSSLGAPAGADGPESARMSNDNARELGRCLWTKPRAKNNADWRLAERSDSNLA